MKTWFTYIVVSQLTGSPLLGIAVVAALWFGGGTLWLGRVPDPRAPFRTWARIRRLRAEIGMNPHHVDHRTELGGLLAKRRPAEAKVVLDDVVRRHPELALPHYHLGVAQLELGETEAGRASIERALTLRKDLRFGEPLVRLGDHYLGQGQHAAALAAYERATVVHSSSAEAWFKAGKAAAGTGDKKTAHAHWEEALASTAYTPGFKARVDRPWRWRSWLALRGL
ncbi:MAG: tetratricopeptide repeat protein [Myxococcota bacterium]